MTPQEIIDVVTAFRDGKAIECIFKIGSDPIWGSLSPQHEFDFSRFNYRVKPKPMELWVNIYPDEKLTFYLSREEADKLKAPNRIRRIRVREVLE